MLILLLGVGGGGYWGYGRGYYGGSAFGGGIGFLVIIILFVWLMTGGHL